MDWEYAQNDMKVNTRHGVVLRERHKVPVAM